MAHLTEFGSRVLGKESVVVINVLYVEGLR